MHTPAPWRINKWQIIGADNSVICNVIPWDVSGTRDEDLDNLNLLRDAPELLEACQEILRALTSPTRELLDSTRREMEPCERLLKEVIAKATRNPS